MIVSKTPLRISFAGGGTDIRSYYKHNKFGAVLSSSIDSYIYVSVKKQNSLFEKYRLNYSQTELVDDLENIENPIIRESLRYLEIDDSLLITNRLDHYDQQYGSDVCVNNTFELLLDSEFDPDNRQI